MSFGAVCAICGVIIVGGCGFGCLTGDDVGAIGCTGDGCVCAGGCGAAVLFGVDVGGLKS